MAKKLTPRDLERGAQYTARTLAKLLAQSTVPRRGSVLADIIHRVQESSRPDGYGTSSPGANTVPADPPKGGDPLHTRTMPLSKGSTGYAGSATESALESLMGDVCPLCAGAGVLSGEKCQPCGGTGRRFHDPVARAAGEIFTALAKMTLLSTTVQHNMAIILNAGETSPEEDHHCLGCHRPVEGTTDDPWRNGLCSACRTAFGRWWNAEQGLGIRSVWFRKGNVDGRIHWAEFVAEKDAMHMEDLCPVCIASKIKPNDDWRHERPETTRSK